MLSQPKFIVPAKFKPVVSAILALTMGILLSGCAAFRPVHGIPARYLPEEFRGLSRAGKRTIDLSLLKQMPPKAYLVDTGDVLGIYIEGVLGDRKLPQPVNMPLINTDAPPSFGFPIPVRDDGTISLPLVGSINVRGMTIGEVEAHLKDAYTKNKQFLNPENERILVSLQRPRTYRILVIRQEAASAAQPVMPGFLNAGALKRGTGQVVSLQAYKNDVLHALAQTGGLPGLDAENAIYVIRRRSNSTGWTPPLGGTLPNPPPLPIPEKQIPETPPPNPNSAKRGSKKPAVIRAQSLGDTAWPVGGNSAPVSDSDGSVRRAMLSRSMEQPVESYQRLIPPHSVEQPASPIGQEQSYAPAYANEPVYQTQYRPAQSYQAPQQYLPVFDPNTNGWNPAASQPAPYVDQTPQFAPQPAPQMDPRNLAPPPNWPQQWNNSPPPVDSPSFNSRGMLVQPQQNLPAPSLMPPAPPAAEPAQQYRPQFQPPAEPLAPDRPVDNLPTMTPEEFGWDFSANGGFDGRHVIKIPIRLGPGETVDLQEQDVILEDGDIVFIESRDTEVFYTGGLLSSGQYTLPRDYDLNVLQAIAIAQARFGGGSGSSQATASVGGQSSLNNDVSISASSVIILRYLPDGRMVPIEVDLYKARIDVAEQVIIQPGDYILLQYKKPEACMAFIERHLLEGAIFGLAAAQLNRNGN